MRVILTLEDTPKGIKTKVEWIGNGVSDYPEASISMKIMAQFANDVKAMSEIGAVYVEKEED